MPSRRTITALLADGTLDADLAALLWALADAGVPLVIASRETGRGEELRAAIRDVTDRSHSAADGALAGGTLVADSLEDVLGVGAGGRAPDGGVPDRSVPDGGGAPVAGVPDVARDLGVVVVMGAKAGGRRVTSAHYIRPVERDKAGHLQRRPPALLAAWDERAGRFDHFDWGISDELATRAGVDAYEFEGLLRRRARLLADLAAAGVSDAEELRRRISGASLAAPESDEDGPQADAPH